MEVTKQFKFSAAHRLPDDPGPCHELHGHTYVAEVTARGPVNDGMVIHFDAMKGLWETVESYLDHKNLNETLPPAAQPPTTENVVAWLLDRLHRANPLVAEVVLWEGPAARARASLDGAGS